MKQSNRHNNSDFNRTQSLIKISLMVFLVMVLSGCESPQQAEYNDQKTQQSAQLTEQHSDVESSTTDTITILALGDSLTEGLGVKKNGTYPALLQRALQQHGFPQVKVINSGLSGETSSGLRNRVDWVLQLKPDLTILNIGANDAIRGLPLKLTTDNINDIIKRIQASGSEVVLAGMEIYDNLGQEYVAGFKDMYPIIAEQHNLVMIPFFLNHVAGDPSLNQADMIHPTTAGYEIIVQRNVLPIVLPLLEQLPQFQQQTNTNKETH